MGREIRRVPPNWEHPKNEAGNYQPMFDRNYHEEAKSWIEAFNSFKPTEFCQYYWEFDYPPDEKYCVPYTKDQATWYQVYETVSEGTPCTPPFETQDELVQHLVEYGESYNPYCKGVIDSESAKRFVFETQWVPSFTVTNGEILMGIHQCKDR